MKFCDHSLKENAMNRTNLLIVTMIALAVFAVARAQNDRPAQQPVGPVGRYQLTVANHEVRTASGVANAIDVLRIDTSTGNADVWIEGVDQAGKLANFWSPIR